jgi:serine/threonine protein kinase
MSNKPYKIIKQVGKGSYGVVYLCQNKIKNQLCVIKRINLSKLDNKEKEETINESKILQKLDHQNIIKFIEVFIEKKSQTTLNIVTEYADDGDLSQKINSQPKKNLFPENLILDYFTQICLALKHIHDKKIIHRDLKSQNIFLTKKGLIKIGDFGVAKNLKNTWKKASTMIGTPYYLSPEIVLSKPYSFKSDIWSLGVLLYEMMCLKMPFDAVSLPMLTLKIMKGNFTPPSNFYSKDLRFLLSCLLNVNPDKRPNINQILKMDIIRNRIKMVLVNNCYNKEFSSTIVKNYQLHEKCYKKVIQSKNINCKYSFVNNVNCSNIINNKREKDNCNNNNNINNSFGNFKNKKDINYNKNNTNGNNKINVNCSNMNNNNIKNSNGKNDDNKKNNVNGYNYINDNIKGKDLSKYFNKGENNNNIKKVNNYNKEEKKVNKSLMI